MQNKELVFSSFESFSAKFGELVEKNKDSNRVQHIKRYFERGGVISLAGIPTNGAWPEVIYPTKLKLRKEIQKLEKQKTDIERRVNDWKGQHRTAQLSDVTNNVKKFGDKLYWQHTQKYLTDPDYRKDADAVKLPVHLVSHPKYHPMINTFVNDLEYRKQLTETVSTSIVYKDNPRVAKLADEQKKFRLEQSQKNVTSLQKQLEESKNEIAMLREIENWSKK
ncbi:MAG: hypothetical protein V1777_02850 [Candidatus Micrarchaeota archaeon]